MESLVGSPTSMSKIQRTITRGIRLTVSTSTVPKTTTMSSTTHLLPTRSFSARTLLKVLSPSFLAATWICLLAHLLLVSKPSIRAFKSAVAPWILTSRAASMLLHSFYRRISQTVIALSMTCLVPSANRLRFLSYALNSMLWTLARPKTLLQLAQRWVPFNPSKTGLSSFVRGALLAKKQVGTTTSSLSPSTTRRCTLACACPSSRSDLRTP